MSELKELRTRVDQLEAIVESLIGNQVSHLAHITVMKDVLEENNMLPDNYDFLQKELAQEIELTILNGPIIGDTDDEEGEDDK